jgi:hypothetical protein
MNPVASANTIVAAAVVFTVTLGASFRVETIAMVLDGWGNWPVMKWPV